MTEKSPKKKPAVKKATKTAKTIKTSSSATKTKATTTVEKASAPKVKNKDESFENPHVKVQAKFKEGCQVQLEVSLSELLLKDSYVEAIRQVSKSISLPGFRKGKVPQNIVEKKYTDHIEDHWKHIFLQKGLDNSLLLTKLTPINKQNIRHELKEHTKKHAHLIFHFETHPIVPDISLEKIKIPPVEREEVKQDKVEEVLDIMRSYKAKWTPIEDRAAKEGDYVDLDIQNLETKQQIVNHKRVQLMKGRLSEWLIKLVTGMKTGASKEAMSKKDKNMTKEEQDAFKATKCKVTVQGIFHGELPELDEAFAKEMGTQSVANLKTQVLLRLNKNADEIMSNKQKKLLDDALIKAVQFDLPLSLLEAEQQTKLKIKLQELKHDKVSDEDIKKRQKEIEAEVKESATTALKLFFILQKIAQQNSIIVTEKELREEMMQRLTHLNLPQEYTTNTDLRNQILHEMRMNSFVDILSNKVKNHILHKMKAV